jgi:hypothetical protein
MTTSTRALGLGRNTFGTLPGQRSLVAEGRWPVSLVPALGEVVLLEQRCCGRR